MAKENADLSYDLNIDMTLFIYEYPEIAEAFYNHSLELIEGLQEMLGKIQKGILEEDNMINLTLKRKVSGILIENSGF